MESKVTFAHPPSYIYCWFVVCWSEKGFDPWLQKPHCYLNCFVNHCTTILCNIYITFINICTSCINKYTQPHHIYTHVIYSTYCKNCMSSTIFQAHQKIQNDIIHFECNAPFWLVGSSDLSLWQACHRPPWHRCLCETGPVWLTGGTAEKPPGLLWGWGRTHDSTTHRTAVTGSPGA